MSDAQNLLAENQQLRAQLAKLEGEIQPVVPRDPGNLHPRPVWLTPEQGFRTWDLESTGDVVFAQLLAGKPSEKLYSYPPLQYGRSYLHDVLAVLKVLQSALDRECSAAENAEEDVELPDAMLTAWRTLPTVTATLEGVRDLLVERADTIALMAHSNRPHMSVDVSKVTKALHKVTQIQNMSDLIESKTLKLGLGEAIKAVQKSLAKADSTAADSKSEP